MLKVSVIGVGRLGGIHAKLWKTQRKARLAGVFDPDEKRASEVAAQFECEKFSSLEEAIEKSDALTIAAPTSIHHEIVEKCVAAGKHCFIEKPITEKYEQAAKIIASAKSSGVVLQVGHVERFNPGLAALKNYELAPLFIEAHRLSRFQPRATDVSVVHDLMIHDIDITLRLVRSKVASVDANGVALLTETPDIANARIKFENGAVANLTASRISANPMRKMRFFQKNAYISIDFAEKNAEVFRLLEEGETPPETGVFATMLGSIETGLKNKNIYFEKPEIPEINAIAEEQKAFVDSVENGAPVAVEAEEAAEALRIAELVSEKIETSAINE